MTTIPETFTEVLRAGWTVSFYDGYQDFESGKYFAIAHDIPCIFASAIYGTGHSPQLALDDLIKNIQTDEDEEPEIEEKPANSNSDKELLYFAKWNIHFSEYEICHDKLERVWSEDGKYWINDKDESTLLPSGVIIFQGGPRNKQVDNTI